MQNHVFSVTATTFSWNSASNRASSTARSSSSSISPFILPFAKQSSCAVIAFMLNKGLHGGNALDLSCYLSVTYALGKPYISISLLDKKVMLHNKSTKCSLSTNKVMMQYYYCCYQLLGTICDQMLPGVTKSNQVSPDRIV